MIRKHEKKSRAAQLWAEPQERTETHRSEKWRRIALYFALLFVFFRVSYLHEVLTTRYGLNFYPLYVFGVPAIVGTVVSGGLRRCLRFRAAVYWVCFALWMALATIFSSWRGGSFQVISTYYKADLIMLFVIGGLMVTSEECKRLIFALAAGAAAILLLLLAFGQKDEAGRMTLGLENGSIANSNDYAAHLLLLLPFVLWILLTTPSLWKRVAAAGVLGFGLYEVLASGSRGALIASAVLFVSYLATTTPRQRRFALLAVPVAAILAFALLPGQAVRRMFSFRQTEARDPTGAMESSAIREQLLRDSIRYTLYHPLFGLGPGQFYITEGGSRTTPEGVPLWYQVHNSYAQAACENGIPALLFMLAGLASSLLLLRRTEKRCRQENGPTEMATALLCARLAIVGFCTAIFFLNFMYSFHLPAIVGIAIALASASAGKVEDLSRAPSMVLENHRPLKALVRAR